MMLLVMCTNHKLRRTGDADAMMGGYNIDITKLWKWLTDNKNSTGVTFNKSDFVTTQAKKPKITIALSSGNEIEIMVKLLNNGIADTKNPKIDIHFEGMHTVFGITFYTNDGKTKLFEIQTNSYYEYELLLQALDYTVNYQEILNQYNTAFSKAGNDCDKLDVIYERIPAFVSLMRKDADLIKDLLSLSGCAIDHTGTNESVAVTKLLANIKDGKLLYSTLFPCPQVLEWSGHNMYYITRKDVWDIKTPEFINALISNFGGYVGLAFGITEGIYKASQDYSVDNAINTVNKTESAVELFQFNPTLSQAVEYQESNAGSVVFNILEKVGETAANDPVVGNNQEWFDKLSKKSNYLGKGWGVYSVYKTISDLTPSKKQYLEQMLFDCMSYCVTGVSIAVGGTSNYLHIPQNKFNNLQDTQTYISKMWEIILNQSLGKSIRNDSDYSTIKQDIMNILKNDIYFYGKR
ncbi:hypothetical protein FACS189463_2040 [Bacteroidia bacterium]|nr:hypothetical protein FACS189463_2040 [Bacteroidia bacterium]